MSSIPFFQLTHFNFGILHFVWTAASEKNHLWEGALPGIFRRQLPKGRRRSERTQHLRPSHWITAHTQKSQHSSNSNTHSMMSSRTTASKRSSMSAVMVLDATLVSIKIVDTQPEQELQAQDKTPPSKPLVHHDSQAPPAQPRARHHEHQTSLSILLRWFVALVPNTIFACVSGALGLACAVAVSLLALLVLVAACVVQFVHEMELMLVETDSALLQFTTGTTANPLRQQTEKTPMKSPGSELVQAARSLLSLSCDLLAIGFFKGTLALSYCCSLYVTIAIPTLVWSAIDSGSATELFQNQSFNDAPVTFALFHGGLWIFALAWLGVTARMSQWCSQNLSSRR